MTGDQGNGAMPPRREMAPREQRLARLDGQAARLSARLARLRARSDRLSWARLGLFAASVVVGLAFCGLANQLVGLAVTVLLFGAFVVAVVLHRRVDGSVRRHETLLGIVTTQQGQMQLAWDKLSPPAPFTVRPEHPFEPDLNLVGPRSLHHLLDTTVAPESRERLRGWLTDTEPDAAAAMARQALVRELAPRVRFRNRLRLNALVEAQEHPWEPSRLIRWLAMGTPPERLIWPLLGSLGLIAITAPLFALYMLDLLPPLWLITFIPYALLQLWYALRGSDSFGEGLMLSGALRQLEAVFSVLERAPVASAPALATLMQPFLDRAERPAAYLGRLGIVVAASALQQNPVLGALLNAVVPWNLGCSYLMGLRREALADRLPDWLDRWYQVEALGALANFAHLNPTYHFPTVVPSGSSNQLPLVGRRLGHPLISHEHRVSNDFAAPHLGSLTLVTGSNMSGKSSFLRTIGLNLCLAYAGGPVVAESLTLIPLRLFTAMNVSDSVTDGISYFYAEVRRLRRLLLALDETNAPPLCFLIDEIFRGTNNRERLLGSRAYLRAVAGRHAIGLVSTHDLELVRLADEIPSIRNAHFREDVVDGEMHFDYTLRPGPSPTTNALKIMQLAGLPVDAGEGQLST